MMSVSRSPARAAQRFVAGVVALTMAFGPTGMLPASAQNLPNLGEESATVLSPQMERRIGESYYRDLRRDPTYLDDPEIKAYVESLGAQLIAAGPDPGMEVEFFVMKDPTINAFAMLGGFIGVNTGLITAAENESEAASVLAHELGHLTQKHIARSVSAGQRSSMVSMIAMALALLAARSNGQAAAGALMGAQAFQVQSQLAYSRDFEREADRVGFDTLSKAGFDVTAMPAFFEKLQRAGRVYESSAPVYVRSHPLTTERIADVRNRAQGARYRQHLDPLVFHLVRAKLRATGDASVDGVREAQRAFATQIAERTYASEAAARYGYAQALLASRDVKGAQAALAALPRGTEHPMIDSLGARIRLAAGDSAGAIRLLQTAVKRYPREAYLRMTLAEMLQGDGRHADALDLVGELLRDRRGDPRLYEMQARSFAALGRVMSQHQALGEYYAALGSPMAALEQFQIARCAGGGDFYQQSILDARIREIGDRILEERALSAQGDKGGAGGAAGGGPRGPGAGPQRPPQRC